MTNLFVSAPSSTVGGTNQLAKTAELTQASSIIVGKMFELIKSDEEKYGPMVIESQKSHDAMDNFIKSNYDLQTVDTDFLLSVDEETADKMLKSQQSKRSRLKAMVMTIETYRSLMTGAASELLLRQVFGMTKSTSGFGVRKSEIGYSEEQLVALQNDQESLGKAIRNVQSKKSIAKSKIDFDETSDRWLQLLETEEILKSLRISGGTTLKVDDRIARITDLLSTLDIDKLKAAEAKDALNSIWSIINNESTELEVAESAE